MTKAVKVATLLQENDPEMFASYALELDTTSLEKIGSHFLLCDPDFSTELLRG